MLATELSTQSRRRQTNIFLLKQGQLIISFIISAAITSSFNEYYNVRLEKPKIMWDFLCLSSKGQTKRDLTTHVSYTVWKVDDG